MNSFMKNMCRMPKSVCIAIKRIFSSLFGRKNKEDGSERFVEAWADVLSSDADVFTGLYASLEKLANGTAKKPERILNEWRKRTRYKWETEPVYEINERFLETASDDADSRKRWAELLLEAAALSGIEKEPEAYVKGGGDNRQYITVGAGNAGAYIEWDGGELTEGDTAEIIFPAWYRNGKLLEQGHCRKCGG